VTDLQDILADLTSGDDARAESAIPKIGELGNDAISALLDLTRSKDSDHRWWAVRALANSPQARTEDLTPLLDDSSPEVRAAAALALCAHPGESAAPALVKAMHDEDPLTAGLAGNALVAIGSPAVPALLEVMREAPLNVRIIALRALAEIRDHRAVKTMMEVLEKDDSAILQYWAKEGLERLGLNMVYVKP
jgi:HEAT repeat protein